MLRMTLYRAAVTLWLITMLVLAGACGGGSKSDRGPKLEPTTVRPSASPAGNTPSVPVIARPLNVTMSLDTAHATTATLFGDGGSIRTTAEDGTTYELKFAEDSVLTEAQITLSPVADITGIELPGRMFGIDLSPSGTWLWEPATLTITPAGRVGAHAIAFAYEGSGGEFHRYPLAYDGASLTINILHFSGVVVYLGDNNYYTPEEDTSVPTDWQSQLEQAIADLLNQDRQDQLLGAGSDPELGTKVSFVFREYFYTVIQPMLAQIERDCASWEQNGNKILGWSRQANLWGLKDVFASETSMLSSAVAAGARTCWNQERAACASGDEVNRLPRLRALGRQLLFMGAYDGAEDDPAFAECGGEGEGPGR